MPSGAGPGGGVAFGTVGANDTPDAAGAAFADATGSILFDWNHAAAARLHASTTTTARIGHGERWVFLFIECLFIAQCYALFFNGRSMRE
jgi:hypothetical protein